MKCSFCGRRDSEVEKLVAGPKKLIGRVYICDRHPDRKTPRNVREAFVPHRVAGDVDARIRLILGGQHEPGDGTKSHGGPSRRSWPPECHRLFPVVFVIEREPEP